MRRICGGHGFFVACMQAWGGALSDGERTFILGGMFSGRYAPLLGHYRKKSA